MPSLKFKKFPFATEVIWSLPDPPTVLFFCIALSSPETDPVVLNYCPDEVPGHGAHDVVFIICKDDTETESVRFSGSDFEVAEQVCRHWEHLQHLRWAKPIGYPGTNEDFQKAQQPWRHLVSMFESEFCHGEKRRRAAEAKLGPHLPRMNDFLKLHSCLVGNQLVLLDVAMYCLLNQAFGTLQAAQGESKCMLEQFQHIRRWYNLVHHLTEKSRNLVDFGQLSHKVEDERNNKILQAVRPRHALVKNLRFPGLSENALPGAVYGKVVTRFPPEPSGYLHIGHAKAALLNSYYASANGGKLILRFDDTNPAKEKSEFEDSIRDDLQLLEVSPDMVSRSSDYFEVTQSRCEELLRKGHAYVDDTSLEQMRLERGQGIESAARLNSCEQNLSLSLQVVLCFCKLRWWIAKMWWQPCVMQLHYELYAVVRYEVDWLRALHVIPE